MDAIILAGGKGNRMEHELPKPLVPVKGKAILAHQLDYLLGSEVVENIILSLGHRADEIVGHVRSQYPSVVIDFSIEQEPLGTAGALKQSLTKVASPRVLVLNCDDITDIDLRALAGIEEHTICVARPRLPFGRVVEKDGYAHFEEKPLLDEWTSCGWYVFRKDAILPHLPEKGSLEYDVFPKIKMRLYKHEGFWEPLNTRKDILEFETTDWSTVLQS